MARRITNSYSNNLIELLQSSKNAFCIDGKCLSIPIDNEEEVFWMDFCSEQGDANAQFQKALCLITGNVHCKNYLEAIRLMEMAAQKIVDVQFFVALCYTYGILVEKNAQKAVYWYDKAAANGCDEAMCNLGICYLSGFGVERDIEIAYDFLIKAAKSPIGIIKKGNGYAKSLCSYYVWKHKDRPQSSGIIGTPVIRTHSLKLYLNKESYSTTRTNQESKGSNIISNSSSMHKETLMIKDPITEKIEKACVVYDHDYKSVLEESWLKFLAAQGIAQAQRVYLALYYAGKFHDKQDVSEFNELMNNWHLQNDFYSCFIKAKIIKDIYHMKHYDAYDLYEKVPEKKGEEAIGNLIKAVEGGIICAIPTIQEWQNIGRCFSTPFEYASLNAPYWENDPNAPINERFVKEEEPICFSLENEKQICFVDYYCKQPDSIRGTKSRFRSIVFKRTLPRSRNRNN